MKNLFFKCILSLFFCVMIFFHPSIISATSIKRSLADINRDGMVDVLDMSLMGSYWHMTNPTGVSALADVNQDGLIDTLDSSIVGGLNKNLTSSCQIADMDNDTDVDTQDLIILRSFIGQTDTSANMPADLNSDGVISSLDEDVLNLNFGCTWFGTKFDTSPSATSDSTPSFPGTVTIVNEGTEGTIKSVSYSLDGGAWTSLGVSASDGVFDGYLEHFSIEFTNSCL